MEDELSEYFAEVATVVSCDLMLDRQTGRSRGFAFIEMESEETARQAVKAMDGKELEGKSISVKEARPREFKPRSGPGPRR